MDKIYAMLWCIVTCLGLATIGCSSIREGATIEEGVRLKLRGSTASASDYFASVEYFKQETPEAFFAYIDTDVYDRVHYHLVDMFKTRFDEEGKLCALKMHKRLVRKQPRSRIAFLAEQRISEIEKDIRGKNIPEDSQCIYKRGW